MVVGKERARRRACGIAAKAALALATSLAAVGSGAASSSPDAGVAAPLVSCLDELEARRAVALIDAMRARGAPCAEPLTQTPPLRWHALLASTAAELAADLARRDALSHVDSRHRGFGARLADGGYVAERAGENVAAGQVDFAQTLTAWARSPAHCATLMTPGYADVGLACVERRGSRYERFWVAHLGTTGVSVAERR